MINELFCYGVVSMDWSDDLRVRKIEEEGCMEKSLNLHVWLEEVESELKNNILGFWKARTIDDTHGGFIGAMNADGEIDHGADKSLVLNARILWTFAAAYRKYGQDDDLHMAERALEQLKSGFADKEYGGFYWMIHPDGTPSEDKKQVYGQAFVIYALAEYIRATDNREPLQLAEDIYRLLERYAYDPVHTGYVEALSREWSETDDLSLSGKDLNERKSMNTHLHVLEAYTNLYRIWKPEGLRLKLKELIEVHLNLILDAESGHFKLFFDDEWNSQSADVSYGHDIEGSWLLWEAAEVLGDPELLDKLRAAAIQMAVATLTEGTDTDGAIYNELHADGRLDDSKDWWPQAKRWSDILMPTRLVGRSSTCMPLIAAGALFGIILLIVQAGNGTGRYSVVVNLTSVSRRSVHGNVRITTAGLVWKR